MGADESMKSTSLSLAMPDQNPAFSGSSRNADRFECFFFQVIDELLEGRFIRQSNESLQRPSQENRHTAVRKLGFLRREPFDF